MKLADLRGLFRNRTDDTSVPPAYSDGDVNAWMNEAVEEAAIRADLLLEVSNAQICSIDITAGTGAYPLHAKITRVTYAQFLADGESPTSTTPITLMDRVELDRIRPTWRNESGRPEFLLTENGTARLVPQPAKDGTLTLEAYRLPLTPMAGDNDVPEIREQHHRYLVSWATFRAYSKPDPELQDPERAKEALEDFEDHFGLRPDADMRQATERVPQFNKSPLS